MSFHDLVLLESCEPSCKSVIVFNCICTWFEGGNAQSWTCELFPQTFPAVLWSFQAAADAVSTTYLGCVVAAVVHYCSTLEMEAKKCLKIPSLCYCLLNFKALVSHTDCQLSHSVEAKLTFSAFVTVIVHVLSKIIIFCTSNLDFNSIKYMLPHWITAEQYTGHWGPDISFWMENGSFLELMTFIPVFYGGKHRCKRNLQWVFITVFLPSVPLLATSCEGVKNIVCVLQYIF